MIVGSVVKISVAGANFSVNERLEKTKEITEALTQTTDALKNEPGVSRLKINAIEQELEAVDRAIDRAGKKTEADLEGLIDPEKI